MRKAKAKGKATARRKRTRDLGPKKVGTVKGGIALSGPATTALKIAYKVTDTLQAPSYKF